MTCLRGWCVAAPNGQSSDCGGTVSAAAGSSSVSLSGGSLPPGSQCTISVNVTGTWGGEKTQFGDGQRRQRAHRQHEHRDGHGDGARLGSGSTGPAPLDLIRQPRRQRRRRPRHERRRPRGNPQGVALDPAAGKIYWANDGSEEISYANLDGTGGGDLVTTGATVYDPDGVALDPAAGKIYWANFAANSISYANLNGTGGGNLVTNGAIVSHPHGVALDPAAGKIYWTNSEQLRSHTPTSTAPAAASSPRAAATVDEPQGVALDPAAGKIYWANARPLGRVDLVRQPQRHRRRRPHHERLQRQQSSRGGARSRCRQIYWGDLSKGRIWFAKLDDSGGGYLNVALLDPVSRPDEASGGDGRAGGHRRLDGWGRCCRARRARGRLTSSGRSCTAPRTALLTGGASTAPDISGATAGTYTASAPGDYRCRVTASNAAGGAAQTSAPHTSCRRRRCRGSPRPAGSLAARS